MNNLNKTRLHLLILRTTASVSPVFFLLSEGNKTAYAEDGEWLHQVMLGPASGRFFSRLVEIEK